jgi:hypothetical protein
MLWFFAEKQTSFYIEFFNSIGQERTLVIYRLIGRFALGRMRKRHQGHRLYR